MTAPVRPTCAEIDLGAVRHNLRRVAAVADGAQVCAVVKADGYGHGAVEVARAALDAGAAWLAVALVEEGEALRAAGIDAPVLLLSEPPVVHADRIVAADLTASVYSPALGDALDRIGRGRRAVAAHLCADTGMGRVGAPRDRWDDLLAAAAGWEGVAVTGTWTHLARADEPAEATTLRQLERFDDWLARLRAAGLDPGTVHAANSAGALLHPLTRFDLVRAGIAVYGLSPAPDLPAAGFGLRQALRLVSEVSHVKRVTAGTPLSYGHTWAAPADGHVATVPVGYADGVPRALSNRADALLHGVRRRFAGNVTMDQLMLWCADDEPAVGDEVVLLGAQGQDAIAVDEWAAIAGTISYEIATSVGPRVPRSYVDDQPVVGTPRREYRNDASPQRVPRSYWGG